MKTHFICTDSPIDKIEAIRIFSLPRENALKVARVATNGSVIVYQDKEGKLYSRSVTFSGSFTFGRGRFDDYLQCCRKLGVLTKQEVAAHFKAASEFDNQRRIRSEVHFLREKMKKLGIKLTVAQDKQLSKLTK